MVLVLPVVQVIVKSPHAMKSHCPTRYSITAGTGLFRAPENGWEIHWSLFKFPNHLHRYEN
jgi:hypothetical protein